MADLNRVTLIGRLTRDADLKYTSSGMAVCKFSIAVNKFRKSGEQRTEETYFFDIVLWGRAGESLNQYLVKGKQVAIDGELRQDRWTQQDGQQRSKVEIVALNVQLLGGNQGTSSSSASNASPQRQVQSQEPQGYQGQDADMDSGFPDDIPF